VASLVETDLEVRAHISAHAGLAQACDVVGLDDHTRECSET